MSLSKFPLPLQFYKVWSLFWLLQSKIITIDDTFQKFPFLIKLYQTFTSCCFIFLYWGCWSWVIHTCSHVYYFFLLPLFHVWCEWFTCVWMHTCVFVCAHSLHMHECTYVCVCKYVHGLHVCRCIHVCMSMYAFTWMLETDIWNPLPSLSHLIYGGRVSWWDLQLADG